MKQPFFFVRRMRSFECRELVTEPKCRISLLLCLIVLCLIIFIRCKQVKCQFNVSASYYTYGVDDVKAPWQFSRTSFISTFALLYDIITRLTILLMVLIKSSNFISFVPRGYRLSKQRRLSSLLILLVVEVLSF